MSCVGNCASELPCLLVPLHSLHFQHLQACLLEITPGIWTRVWDIPRFPRPPPPTLHAGRLWLHQREPRLHVVCRGSTSISELPDLGQRQVLGGIPLSLKRTLNATKRHTPEPLPSPLSPSAAPPLPLSTPASSSSPHPTPAPSACPSAGLSIIPRERSTIP